MRIYSLLLLVPFLYITFSCDDNSEQKKEPVEDSLKTNVKIDSSSTLSVELEGAPEWYNQITAEEDLLIARGYGRSVRADIAEEKALMDAQRKMALMLTDSLNNQALNQQIAPFKIRQKERIQRDEQWHVYVLLEKETE
ncbi:MAG: hypothetical protein JXR46_07025 [Calditrichaceae bacterium]|nr:hypothetical protein [Calditrichaceae bacterium]MBN2708782.1 hypothetical protein [Calditrichaceae bacterium]RQV97688.1 MAG: hypothetical protein EH224_01325 [Calditrichota bacterium]